MDTQSDVEKAAPERGNNVTLDELDAALADFDARKDGAGELHLFVENPEGTHVVQDDRKGDASVLHSRIGSAASRRKLYASIAAVLPHGAQVCFSRTKPAEPAKAE